MNIQAKPGTAAPPQSKGKPLLGDGHCSALCRCLWENVHQCKVDPASVLTLPEKFSGKDSKDFIMFVTPCLLLKTDLLPTKRHRDLETDAEHSAHKKPVITSESSCHQTSAKGSSGWASYHTTSSQIQPFSGTATKCLKICLSSSPKAECP